MLSLRIPIASALLIFLAAGTAYGTTVRLAAHDELVRNSDLVVLATIAHTGSAWRQGRIYTHYQATLEEVWAGQAASKTIEVLTLGGVVDGIGQSVPGAARLVDGSRAVLYLAVDSAGAFHPVGMWQGVFRVAHDHTVDPAVIRDQIQVRVVGPAPAAFPSRLLEMKAAVKEAHRGR